MTDHDLKIARRMVAPHTELGRWLEGERDKLRATLGREPTRNEIAGHAIACFRTDAQVRAMTIAAAREATTAKDDE